MMDDPFHPHPHPHGSRSDDPQAVQTLARDIAVLRMQLDNLEAHFNNLRGDQGIERNGDVLSLTKPNTVPLTAILTLCVNGAPGWVEVFVKSPPATF